MPLKPNSMRVICGKKDAISFTTFKDGKRNPNNIYEKDTPSANSQQLIRPIVKSAPTTYWGL